MSENGVVKENENENQLDMSKLNIYQKINKAKEIIGVVKKDGKVSFKSTNYNYQKAEDIEFAVREACLKVGLAIIPYDCEIVSDVNGICTCRYEYELVDIDNKTTIRMRMCGMGQDSGDKRIYKAHTGAFKYVLKQLFQIPSEDTDPDAMPSGAMENNKAIKAKAETTGNINWKDYVAPNGKFAGKTIEVISTLDGGMGWIRFWAGKQSDAQPYCVAALQELDNAKA